MLILTDLTVHARYFFEKEKSAKSIFSRYYGNEPKYTWTQKKEKKQNTRKNIFLNPDGLEQERYLISERIPLRYKAAARKHVSRYLGDKSELKVKQISNYNVKTL